MPTEYSIVIAMPPCSWIASWPTCRPALDTCKETRRAASATGSGSPRATTIVAQSTIERVSCSETYMSAARKVRAWKVLSGTPNCLRLRRYSQVVGSRNCMAPSAWLAAITREMSCTVEMLLLRSAPGSPRGVAAVPSKETRGARGRGGRAVEGDPGGPGAVVRRVAGALGLRTVEDEEAGAAVGKPGADHED